jgi:hypothetical protein
MGYCGDTAGYCMGYYRGSAEVLQGELQGFYGVMHGYCASGNATEPSRKHAWTSQRMRSAFESGTASCGEIWRNTTNLKPAT